MTSPPKFFPAFTLGQPNIMGWWFNNLDFDYHKKFIRNWSNNQNITSGFEIIWEQYGEGKRFNFFLTFFGYRVEILKKQGNSDSHWKLLKKSINQIRLIVATITIIRNCSVIVTFVWNALLLLLLLLLLLWYDDRADNIVYYGQCLSLDNSFVLQQLSFV